MLRRIYLWIFGPERSWVEEEAFYAGLASAVDEDDPFTDFKTRRAWRKGREVGK